MPGESKEFTRNYWGQLPRSDREPIFRDAILAHFGNVEDVDEYATIAAALSMTEACNTVFRDKVDRDLKNAYNAVQGPNKLTTAFINLMQPFGFSTVQGVVFAGDAGAAFAPVVGNGVLFKDGTGPTHGEYSHSLQWLLLCKLRGHLNLPQDMAKFYKNAISYPSAAQVEEEMGRTKQITLWDFLVDCVLDDPKPREHLIDNILSNSWRTPAYLTRALCGGALTGTWTSDLLLARIAKRGPRFGEDYRTMRRYHHAKQYAKGGQMVRVAMAWIPEADREALGIKKKDATVGFLHGVPQDREVEVQVDLATNTVVLPRQLAEDLGIGSDSYTLLPIRTA